MFKPSLVAATLALSLGCAVSQAAPIVLDTGPGGFDTESLLGLTLGNTLTFEYQYSNVVYVGGPWIGFNANFVNPCCGPQVNDWRPIDSDWQLAFMDTTGTASPNDLVFTANTFGAVGNFATITIRNVAVDQRVVAAAEEPASVPEPATLGMLGLGLGLVAMARRRKSVS